MGTVGLGAISKSTDSNYFFFASVVLRFIQGMGDVLLQITSYTIITNTFSD
jgi:hypothetical protein